MCQIHQASLVDPSLHSPAILELLDLSINDAFIQHIIQFTVDLVEFALQPASPKPREGLQAHRVDSFTQFANNVIRKSRSTLPTLLVVLVYLDRVRCQLAIKTEVWACERVFLGALIVASKFHNDRSLRNVHWAISTGCLGIRDVGRIERDFFEALQWKLTVSEADILDHHDTVIALYPSHRSQRPCPTLLLPLDDTGSIYSEASDSCSSSPASTPSPITPPTLAPPIHAKSLLSYDTKPTHIPEIPNLSPSNSQQLVDGL